MTRRANVDLFARRPAKRARAEGDSIVVYRSGEALDGEAEEANGERRARRAAEAALAAMRVAARRVQDLSGLVYELEAQLPAKDAERPEQLRTADEPEASELRADAERNAAALVAAGNAIASLRGELGAARENARARAEREREARRIAGELVETATAALARAEQQLAEAEATAGADRERARRALAAKAAAEAEVGRLRHEVAAAFAARDRERDALWEQLDDERRELRGTEDRLITTIADKDARIEELERERAGHAGAETVAPGPSWLGRALVAIAERDPENAARLALGLLPLYGLACQEEADWDLVLGEAGAWRVTAAPGRLAALDGCPRHGEGPPASGWRPTRAGWRRYSLARSRAPRGATGGSPSAARGGARGPRSARSPRRRSTWRPRPRRACAGPGSGLPRARPGVAPAWTTGHASSSPTNWSPAGGPAR